MLQMSPYWKHEFEIWMLGLMPEGTVGKVVDGVMKPRLEAHVEDAKVTKRKGD